MNNDHVQESTLPRPWTLCQPHCSGQPGEGKALPRGSSKTACWMILLPDQGENDLGVWWPNISKNLSIYTDCLSCTRTDSKCFVGISSFNPDKTPQSKCCYHLILLMKKQRG